MQLSQSVQITQFELIVGIAGLVSLCFNLFQLYRDRINRSAADRDRTLHIATLRGIRDNLRDAMRALTQLGRSGATSDTLLASASRSLDSECTQVEELLNTYYDAPSDRSLDAGREDPDSPADAELVVGGEAITAAMIDAVARAQNHVFAVGGRSRNNAYLLAVKQRVQRGDVRYVRTLTGDHIRHPLCQHLDDLFGHMELGWLPEDKYGGILATDDTVVIALQSSTISALDKGLVIHNPEVAADYRLYALELYSSSTCVVDPEFYHRLCKQCRKDLGLPPPASDTFHTGREEAGAPNNGIERTPSAPD